MVSNTVIPRNVLFRLYIKSTCVECDAHKNPTQLPLTFKHPSYSGTEACIMTQKKLCEMIVTRN